MQGNRWAGVHWLYCVQDTCLLVDKAVVQKKARELAQAVEKEEAKARKERDKRRVRCLFSFRPTSFVSFH